MENSLNRSQEGVKLPRSLDLLSFADARCQEIMALSTALDNAQKGGLIFQRLPKAMRRRVMSHHTKRMPRRLQEAHAKQLEKNGAFPTSKRPSRKFRRRPQNLLLEYNRRQKKCVWLETHIWHAKRFRMVEKWGYKIPESPYDKCYRACYRASANHCLLQDISYFCCLELKGFESELVEGLGMHTHSECGLTLAAKAFLTGCREGSVMLYKKGLFPFGAVGSVDFVWKAEEGAEINVVQKRTLWIWAHPAIYKTVVDMFVDTFELSESLCTETIPPENTSAEMKKLDPHGVLNKATRYTNEIETVSLVLLKDKLNRFRLTGPLSQAILTDALNVTACVNENGTKPQIEEEEMMILDSSDDDDETCKVDASEVKLKKSGRSTKCTPWWRRYYYPIHRSLYQEQHTFWTSMKGFSSPAELPPHQVLSLTVLDPRYQLPPKRIKIVPNSKVHQMPLHSISKSLSLSPIWSEDVRLNVTASKLSNGDLAKLRSSAVLVPGFRELEVNVPMLTGVRLSEAYEPSRLPVLLLQRPGSQDPAEKRTGFGSGWDVVLPAGWAMPLWLALLFRGARPAGLRQGMALAFEAGTLLTTFAPDTDAGRSEEAVAKQQRADTYYRLPPNKRPNFIKLGIASPFACCWDILVSDWCQNKQRESSQVPFYVLRDKTKRDALKSSVNSRAKHSGKSNLTANSNHSDRISDLSSLFSNMNHNCLVPVRVETVRRGSPEDCALICIPTQEDLDNIKIDAKCGGPVEPVHSDLCAEERKTARNEHKKELKRLRKQRVNHKAKLKKQMDAMLEKGDNISHLLNKMKDRQDVKVIDTYAEKMRSLWVPDVKTIKDSCSRTIAGFVSKGDFSFTEACGVGLGYVPLPALVHLFRVWNDKPLVLIRNIDSFQYNFGILKIC